MDYITSFLGTSLSTYWVYGQLYFTEAVNKHEQMLLCQLAHGDKVKYRILITGIQVKNRCSH